jgi:hypothetical protein
MLTETRLRALRALRARFWNFSRFRLATRAPSRTDTRFECHVFRVEDVAFLWDNGRVRLDWKDERL